MGRNAKQWVETPEVYRVYLSEELTREFGDDSSDDRLEADTELGLVSIAGRYFDPEQQRRFTGADEWDDAKAKSETYRRRDDRIAAGGKRLRSAERRAVFEAFGGRCVYCNSKRANAIEHIKPISRGGIDELSNVAIACADCNSSKSSTPLSIWITRFTEEKQRAIARRLLNGQAAALALLGRCVA